MLLHIGAGQKGDEFVFQYANFQGVGPTLNSQTEGQFNLKCNQFPMYQLSLVRGRRKTSMVRISPKTVGGLWPRLFFGVLLELISRDFDNFRGLQRDLSAGFFVVEFNTTISMPLDILCVVDSTRSWVGDLIITGAAEGS